MISTCLGNAGGYLSKLLVIVQVKSMPEVVVKSIDFWLSIRSVLVLPLMKKQMISIVTVVHR